ncbi:MAG TPA: hypothetical protein VF875_15400 [Anaeromyxobacter sp.]
MSLPDRFRRIERSRPEAPPAPADPDGATAERIEGVEGPGRAPVAAPAASGADLDRFAPPPPPAIELLPEDADRRPFTRCERCGMDHNFLVAECTGCGARLDTPEQRAFNDRLWEERRAERVEEDRLHAEREAERADEAAALAGSRRAMGEALAREVGERERRRLDGEGWRGGTGVSAGPLLVGIASGLGAAGRWILQRLGLVPPPP